MKLRKDQLVQEMITAMHAQEFVRSYAHWMHVICCTVRLGRAHPELEELGMSALRFNIRHGYTSADSYEEEGEQ